jgi:precorrin-2 dehydrogenase/sirohydrochlorin ferrochelatase
MRYYPVHLDIKNRNCLVVGGGTVGTRKVNTLLECGARVTVVSPDPTQQLTKLASEGAITLTRRAYRSADLDGAFLVIGATDDESLNQQISNDAALTHTLCNIADRPEVCNFIPKQLRQKLETQFGKEYAEFLLLMGAIRKKLLSQAHKPEAHKDLFNKLIDSDLIQLMQAGKTEEINSLLYKILGEGYKIEALL